MSATTPIKAIPYPVGTDTVHDALAVTIKALAERLEALLPRTGSTGLLTVAATATDYTKAVAFPNPFPAGTVPKVTATPDTANATVGLAVNNVTNTGFTLVYRRHSGSQNIGDCHWVAVAP